MKNGTKNLRDGSKNVRGYMERLPLLKVIFAIFFFCVYINLVSKNFTSNNI